jgi:1-hydroxy-2-naphthoate dioxygenase
MDDAAINKLDAFDEQLAKFHIRGQWTAEKRNRASLDGPVPEGVPHVWKYPVVRKQLDIACTEFPETLDARRSLMFRNPALPYGTTHTMAAGIQLIQPGELAWPHRHSANAMRFVIEGDPKLVTVVDGVAYPMEQHDLILTPNWCWHAHHNQAAQNVTWLDILDVTLTISLNQSFYEQGPEGTVETDDGVRFNDPESLARAAGGRADAEPVPVRYGWSDMEAKLRALGTDEADPCDGATIHYADPRGGGPTVLTMDCNAHMLRPGQQTRSHRHTSSTIYFVVQGEGRTVVGDTEIAWSEHDTFCVPNWAWHHHINGRVGDEAFLFSISDSPALKPLGYYREQTAG